MTLKGYKLYLHNDIKLKSDYETLECVTYFAQ